jgi:hypothetical protein
MSIALQKGERGSVWSWRRWVDYLKEHYDSRNRKHYTYSNAMFVQKSEALENEQHGIVCSSTDLLSKRT